MAAAETVALSDTQAGLRRVAAILAALDDHEVNAKTDDVEAVAAVRFALLDAARAELDALAGIAH